MAEMAIGCHTLVQHKPYFYKPVKEPPSLQTVLAKPVRTVLLDAVCWWMIQAGATWFDYIPLLDSCLPHGDRTCEIFAATGCCINDLLSRITKVPIVAWENQAGKGEVSDKCKKNMGPSDHHITQFGHEMTRCVALFSTTRLHPLLSKASVSKGTREVMLS